MTHITLTSDQTLAVAAATDGVVIADQHGNVIARIPPKLSAEESAIVEQAKQRLASDEARIPSADVLARLKQLGE